MSVENNESWMSLAEICDYLSVSNDTVYRLIKAKDFPAQKIGTRWKAKKSQIDAWIKRNNESNNLEYKSPIQGIDNTNYKILSLFSGCGGLDLGFLGGFTSGNRAFARNKTDIVFANDIDIDAEKCYN